MASTTPLTGSELIDCARANGPQGAKVAANRCGYGDNVDAFESALRQAGEHIGVEIVSFRDLVSTPHDRQDIGIEIAPDSLSNL